MYILYLHNSSFYNAKKSESSESRAAAVAKFPALLTQILTMRQTTVVVIKKEIVI